MFRDLTKNKHVSVHERCIRQKEKRLPLAVSFSYFNQEMKIKFKLPPRPKCLAKQLGAMNLSTIRSCEFQLRLGSAAAVRVKS